MKVFANFEEFLASLNEELQELRFGTNPLTQRPDVICLGHDQDPVYIPGNETIH